MNRILTKILLLNKEYSIFFFYHFNCGNSEMFCESYSHWIQRLEFGGIQHKWPKSQANSGIILYVEGLFWPSACSVGVDFSHAVRGVCPVPPQNELWSRCRSLRSTSRVCIETQRGQSKRTRVYQEVTVKFRWTLTQPSPGARWDIFGRGDVVAAWGGAGRTLMGGARQQKKKACLNICECVHTK